MTDAPPPQQPAPELRAWQPHALFVIVFGLLCVLIAMIARRDKDDDDGKGRPPKPQVPPSPEVRDEAKRRAKEAARARLIALNAKRKADREAKKSEPATPPAAT